MAEATVPEGDIWFERKHGGSRNWTDTGSVGGSARAPFRTASTRDTDDQQELEWAALEKLPTYHRIRTAILDDESQGNRVTSDVRRLGKGQRTNLVEKALATNEQDNERFLLKVKERLHR